MKIITKRKTLVTEDDKLDDNNLNKITTFIDHTEKVKNNLVINKKKTNVNQTNTHRKIFTHQQHTKYT